MVYVISIDGKPLMPCKPVIARLLLKQHKAKVIKKCPFTIKLLYKTKAGNKIDLKPIPKFDKMERIQARKSWIISQETIQNTY